MSAPVIGFAGMTHLGLVSAVSAAAKGAQVIGYDPDPTQIDALVSGVLPVSEPQLDELLKAHAERLSFTSTAADLGQCEVVYVAPDVATDDQGKSDLTLINRLLDTVFDSTPAHAVVVVLSQVPPGFTRARLRPGRILYYQVETLIFGRAVERALYPERYIVGCADPSKPLPAQYAAFLALHGCPVLPMRYESAELAKISINMFLVASVTTANTLAELCEQIGADWAEIVPALKLDRRIGPHAYLAPGLGIAGGNLERDLATVCNFADRLQTDAGVVRAWLVNSRHRKGWAARTIRGVVLDREPGATIGVWGLAYKENTASIKNSPSLATIEELRDVRLKLHDPVVPASAVVHPAAERASTALAAASGVDALMILTPWPEYRAVSPDEIARVMRGRTVLDPYQLLDASAAVAAGLDVHTLGRQPTLAGS